MVQSLTPPSSNGRPVLVRQQSSQRTLSNCNQKEFKWLLQGQGRPERPKAPDLQSEDVKSECTRHKVPELSPDETPDGASGRLAPEEQPSVAWGGQDLGELFALFNPAGVSEAARPLELTTTPAHPGVTEVAELVERWVRRVALGGDQRRGAARLDIGQGRYAGAELLVVAEAGHVSVELHLPATASDPGLGERLRSRLAQRGFDAEVTVR